MKYKLSPYNNVYPKIEDSAYIADNCVIIGDVAIGSSSSIWFNSVLRGDVSNIIIGNNTNIQDGSIIHTSRYDNGSTIIGDNITIGHQALIHACTIKDNAFVGMKACVMDYAIVEEYGFVAAGALITPKTIIKSYELWGGVPARLLRLISDEEISYMHDNYIHYTKLAKEYKEI